MEQIEILRTLQDYRIYLESQEKSPNTIEKYIRDVKRFLNHIGTLNPKREVVLNYKNELEQHYLLTSANSMLMAVNHYLKYRGLTDCCVSTFRQQRKLFEDERRYLSRQEYKRLVIEARKHGMEQLEYMIQTMGMTGIRVGELSFITVESLDRHLVRIHFKNKERVILLPKGLVRLLKNYCRRKGIDRGSIFTTKSGKSIDRRNIWAQMKKLCQGTGIPASKVFPHNLRHLFARCYYEQKKDLVRLADFLGHSSLETTRRYTIISSMEACMQQLDLDLEVEEDSQQLDAKKRSGTASMT